MRDNLEELNRLDKSAYPILLGGAALTRTYVEKDLRAIYKGRVFYGKDAFEGLHLLDRLMEIKRSGVDDPTFGTELSGRKLPPRRSEQLAEVDPATLPPRSEQVGTDNPVFDPPFLGTRVAKGFLSTTSPPTSTRRRSSATSGATGPSPARATRTSRNVSEPSCVRVSTRSRPKGSSFPRSSGAIFPSTPTGTTLSSTPTTPAGPSDTVQFPAPEKGALPLHRGLLQTGRVRQP